MNMPRNSMAIRHDDILALKAETADDHEFVRCLMILVDFDHDLAAGKDPDICDYLCGVDDIRVCARLIKMSGKCKSRQQKYMENFKPGAL